MNMIKTIRGLITHIMRFLREDLLEADTWMARQLRKILLVVRGFHEDHCLMRSSALAYTTLLSIVPLFAALFLLLKAFGAGTEKDVLLEYTEKFLGMLLPEHFDAGGQALAAVIASHIQTFATRLSAMRVGSIGVIFLLMTAISLLSTVEKALNDIWGVTRGRSFIGRIIVYWAMITLLPILFIPAISTQFLVQSQRVADWIASYIPFSQLARLVQGNIIPLLVIAIALTLGYMVLPHTKVRIRSAFVGGLLASVLINLNIRLFSALLLLTGKMDRLTLVYGILAVVPLLLLFAYIGWAIVLMGAEIAFADQNAETYFMEQRSKGTSTATRERLALRIMYELASRYARDQAMPTMQELQVTLTVPIRIINVTMLSLERAGLIVPIKGEVERYMPAHALGHIRVLDVVLAIRRDGHEIVLPEDAVGEELTDIYTQISQASLAEGALTLEGLVGVEATAPEGIKQ